MMPPPRERRFGFVGVPLAVPTAAVPEIPAPDARRRWRESRLFAREPAPSIERADDGWPRVC